MRRPPSIFLILMLFGCVALLPGCTPAPGRPNIVIILTDDSGYSDIGVYGGEIPTPNIDALARNGIRFSKFYNNGRCSPTRASLLTGLYPQKVGVGDMARPQDETPYPGYLGYLSPASVTLAEVLKSGGYTTLMSGKWHLGGQREAAGAEGRFEPLPEEMTKWPNARGFDEFFGTIHGHINYFRPKAGTPFVRQSEIIRLPPPADFYATEAVTSEAIEMMRGARAAGDAPFFLYLAFHAPHPPLQAPEAAVSRHRATYPPDRAAQLLEARSRALQESGSLGPEYRAGDSSHPVQLRQEMKEDFTEVHATVAAMTEIIDSNVGRIVEFLRQAGELDNTLILYMSDNGTGQIRAPLANWPFRGGKGNLLEGGIASHAVVHWPAGIALRGAVVQAEAHVIDLMPTIVELTGSVYPDQRDGNPVPAMAGQSLAGLFRGEEFQRRQPLFWDYQGQQAVLESGWKYLRREDGREFLFDLHSNPIEGSNLIHAHRDKAQLLEQKHADWARLNNILPVDQVEPAKRGKSAPTTQ